MRPTHLHLTTTRLAVLTGVCTLILAGCGSPSTTSSNSQEPAPASSTSAAPTETPTPEETAAPTADSTPGTLMLTPTSSPTSASTTPEASQPEETTSTTADVDDTWTTAVEALKADDPDAFLAVSNQSVLDKLQAVRRGGGNLEWRDWDVMGGNYEGSAEPAEITVIAGECLEGVHGHEYAGQVEGSPTVTCNLVFQAADPTSERPDNVMGLFYLAQGPDGEWTIVDYLRQYQ